MYHEVTQRQLPTFQKYAVTPNAFSAQIKWLAMRGYVAISLDQLLAFRRGAASLPRRPVIITFDDGFYDCVSHAAPILRAHGFTAIFYLVAGLMGQASRWLMAERGIELPLIDWATARQLADWGFECGAHSMTHPHLADLPATACHTELRESRELLEQQLGRPIWHTAYPFGSFNQRVRAIAAEVGYRSACSVEIGRATTQDDPLALRRIPITGHDSLLDFMCRLRTGWPFRAVLRDKTMRAIRWRQRKERSEAL
jgi:peptidoglycan/xylan/chitin deacetylase (PgdA/CDA1 family)